MKKLLTILTIIPSLLMAQAPNTIATKKVKNPKTIKTNSGLEYTITEVAEKPGPKPQAGDMVYVHYTGKLTNDTVFDSSILNKREPLPFKLGVGQVIKGWDEGLSYLNVGDKATLRIPAQLGYGDRDMGKIPPNSTLVFDVQLMGIKEGVKPYDVKGKDTVTTASGLKYVKVVTVKGDNKPKMGDKVTAHYTGYLLDGKVFDSSVDRGQPFSFQIGKGQVIKGWDEGIALLNKGEKARFIIPYDLAYGEQGTGPIPAKATLVFDVELVDFKEGVHAKPYDIAGKPVQTTSSGLQYIVVQKGTGAKVENGNTVTLHYSGYFEDGKMFDSSVEREQSFPVKAGAGSVIKGFDEALLLMSKGDKMRVIIPWQLAYGEQGRGPIPAKANLVFDLEAIDVVK